jgi:hypothetical protein
VPGRRRGHWFQRECGTSPLRRGGSITAPTTRPTRHRRPARVYNKLYSSSDKIIMVREPRKRRRDRGASGKRQRHDPGGAGAARGLIVPSPPRQWHTASDGAGRPPHMPACPEDASTCSPDSKGVFAEWPRALGLRSCNHKPSTCFRSCRRPRQKCGPSGPVHVGLRTQPH